MKSYKHLSEKERIEIALLRKRKVSIQGIAKELNRSPSTISREIERNKWNACLIEYNASAANNSYKKRMSEKAISRNGKIWLSETQKYIEEKLKIGWAPQTISGRMKLEKNPLYVSHETIYQYIYRYRPDLIKYLRWYKPKNYTKRGKNIGIRNIVRIENRQSIVKERKEFGHFEADSVISGQKGKSILNVILEMKSRFVMITKIADKSSMNTMKTICSRLGSFGKELLKTITFDNGTENALHEEIDRKLGTQSYFCRPYASYEKGAVENVNNIIRKYLPKKTNFDKISVAQIKEIEFMINHTPRKILGYKTAYEVFFGVALSS